MGTSVRTFGVGLACGAAVAAALVGATASASSSKPKARAHDPIFMQYGPLKGGSVQNTGTHGSRSWVEVNSFQWGVGRGISSPTGTSSGPGPTSSKLNVHMVTLNLRVNSRFSSTLFQAYTQKAGFGGMELTQGSVSGSTYSPFLRILLKGVTVAAISWSSAPATDGGLPEEQVTLAFQAIKVAYGQRPNVSTATLGSPSAVTSSWSAAASS